MKKRHLTLLTAIAAAAAFAPTAQAALTIVVDENDDGNIYFTWNGLIGASGTAGAPPATTEAPDQIVPSLGQVQLGDRDTANSGNKWTSSGVYAGSSFAFGSGARDGSVTDGGDNFSDFLTDQNINFRVYGNDGTGDLLVGFTDQANTSGIPDLATTVFTGSFSLVGDFAAHGLFDTAGTSLATNEFVTLWTADSGGGSIRFTAIPEPSAALLLGVAGMGLLVRRRRA